MDCDEQQVGLFSYSQEWHFHAAKISDKRSTLLQDCRIADVHELCFQVRNVEKCAVPSGNEVDLLMLRNHVFRNETNENDHSSHEIFRFADTQESCFKAWKSSHMGCSALLCGRFADSEESHFQVSKRSNMGSAVLEGGRSADIHEFWFQAAKRSDMEC